MSCGLKQNLALSRVPIKTRQARVAVCNERISKPGWCMHGRATHFTGKSALLLNFIFSVLGITIQYGIVNGVFTYNVGGNDDFSVPFETL